MYVFANGTKHYQKFLMTHFALIGQQQSCKRAKETANLNKKQVKAAHKHTHTYTHMKKQWRQKSQPESNKTTQKITLFSQSEMQCKT